jgi:hypothetical protein
VTLPPFRPRSATEIVDAAIQLGRRHYAPLVTLGALVAVPGLVLGLVVVWLMPQPAQVNADLGAAAGDMGLALLVSLVSMCWLFVGFGALVSSAATAYVEGRALEPMDALRRALRRAGTLIGAHLAASLLIALVVGAGLLALGIVAGLVVAGMGIATGGAPRGPTAAAIGIIAGVVTVAGMSIGGLFAWARFANVTAVVMLEGSGAFAALGRSNALVRGHSWRVIGVVGMMMVLYVVTYLSMWALGFLFVRSAEISGNIAGVLVVAVYPFMGSLLALLYYDLRIRREGFDLELMARALESAPAEATV